MHARIGGVVALVAIAALAASGCGGSTKNGSQQTAGSNKGSSASNLTKAQYVKSANSMCRAAGKRVPPFPGKQSGSGYATTASLVIPYLRKILAINGSTLATLQNLHPPAEIATGHARLVTAQQLRIKDLRAALDAAVAGDGTGFTAAFQKDQKQDEPRYQQAATHLGLESCVSGR